MDIGFSSDLLSDIEFTNQDVAVINSALNNAIEHSKEYLQKKYLSEESRNKISYQMRMYSALKLKVEDYLHSIGIDTPTSMIDAPDI